MTPKETLEQCMTRLRLKFQDSQPSDGLRLVFFDECGNNEASCLVSLPDNDTPERVVAMAGMKTFTEGINVHTAFCVSYPFGTNDPSKARFIDDFGIEKAIKDGVLGQLMAIEGCTMDGRVRFELYENGQLMEQIGDWEPMPELSEMVSSLMLPHFFLGYCAAQAAHGPDASTALREQLRRVIESVVTTRSE